MERPIGVFERESVEFARALTFTDGVFAIAATLLVVGIETPDIPDTDSVSELAHALDDNVASYVSFLIGFLVIGRYWLAHHAFCSRLARMDQGFLFINMLFQETVEKEEKKPSPTQGNFVPRDEEENYNHPAE